MAGLYRDPCILKVCSEKCKKIVQRWKIKRQWLSLDKYEYGIRLCKKTYVKYVTYDSPAILLQVRPSPAEPIIGYNNK